MTCTRPFCFSGYRLCQNNDSKVLHNSEVTWFSKDQPPFHKIPSFWYKLYKNVIAPFIMLLLELSKLELWSISYSTINVWISLKIGFLSNLKTKWSQKAVFYGILMTYLGQNNRPRCQKKLYERGSDFFQHILPKLWLYVTAIYWISLPYSCENKRGIISMSHDFGTCLFSSHAYFQVIFI